jgi:hypothetical protein
MEQSPDVPASDSSGAQRHAGFHLGGARRLIATTLAVVAVLLGGCGVLVIFSLVTEYEAISESDGWSRDVVLYLVGIPMVPAVAAALIWPAPWSGWRRSLLLAAFAGALVVGTWLSEGLALATR